MTRGRAWGLCGFWGGFYELHDCGFDKADPLSAGTVLSAQWMKRRTASIRSTNIPFIASLLARPTGVVYGGVMSVLIDKVGNPESAASKRWCH